MAKNFRGTPPPKKSLDKSLDAVARLMSISSDFLLVTVVAGVEDVSTVNPDVTLGNFGLDSLMLVEMKQTMQHQYDVSMSDGEIRALTFAKLGQL